MSTLPKHTVVRQHLERSIRDEFGPHDRLPPERTIADDLGVNRLTVRRALDELERAGLIYRVQGAGTFVSEGSIHKDLELTSFSEDMRSRGRQPGSLQETISLEAAGLAAGYALGLSPADPVVRIRRTRTADQSPICLEDARFPAHLVPGLQDGLLGESVYRELEERFGIRVTRADQSIRATVLDESQAASLQVPAFSPALLVRRTARDGRERPVEFAESVYRADLYSFDISITRTQGER